MGKNLLISLCILLVSFAGVAWADPHTPPVRIGAIYGFSGFSNVWSEQARRGIELAQTEINDAGGIGGRPLKIIFEDSGTNARGALNAVTKLIEIDKVDALVGDIISFVTLPMVPVVQRHQKVLVTPSIFDSDMPQDSSYFFSTCPQKESIKPAVEAFFAVNRSVRSIAIICANNTWGRTYLDVWKTVASHRGVSVVDENCISNYDTDMRAEVLRAKGKSPDALIVAFAIDRALQRMRELQFSPVVLSTSDVEEALIARGMQVSDAVGVYFVNWVASKEFQDRFRHRFQKEPIMAPENSYEAVRALARAFEAGGNLDKALSEVHYEGVAGPIDFRGSRVGNLGKAELLVVSRDGIEPVPSAHGEVSPTPD